MSKEDLADFLMISRRTVFRALEEAVELDLTERSERGLRATEKWINGYARSKSIRSAPADTVGAKTAPTVP